jgi:hypothetical protein
MISKEPRMGEMIIVMQMIQKELRRSEMIVENN